MERLEKWNKQLPINHRRMSSKDSICEYHFEDRYIERYFVQKMNDGSVFKLKRIKPLLLPDAVPTIFSSDDFAAIRKRKLSSTDMSTPEVTKISRSSEATMVLKSESAPRICTNSCENILEVAQVYMALKTTNVSESESAPRICTNAPEIIRDVVEETKTCKAAAIYEDKQKDIFDFDRLKKNVHKVLMPSTSWVISIVCESGEDYLIFMKWKSLKPERWIVIKENLTIKVRSYPLISNLNNS